MSLQEFYIPREIIKAKLKNYKSMTYLIPAMHLSAE